MAKQTYEAMFLLSGQLAASFGSTFKSAGKAFQGLKTGAAGFSSAVTGAMGKVSGALTSIPAQVAGLGAGAGFVALGAHAITMASDMEKLGTAMEVHLGSASKAKALIDEIQQFATETPFEFKELADAGKQMLAFGYAGDEVVENLKMMGDVASGLSMPIGDLVYLMGTMKAQGRVFQTDINQLTSRGIPIYDALTKSMKATAEAQGRLTIKVGEGKKAMNVPLKDFNEKHIRTMIEAGQVDFTKVNAGIKQLTSEGGKFYGMIEAQSKTFAGRFSTLKDNVNNLMLQLGQPIVDTLGPYLAKINESPVWTNMADGINEKVKPAIMQLTTALEGQLGGAFIQLGKDAMAVLGSIGTETAKLFGAKEKGPTLPMQPKAAPALGAAPNVAGEYKSVYAEYAKMKGTAPPVPKMGMAPIKGAESYKSITAEVTRMAEAPPPDMSWLKTAEGMVKSLSEAFKFLAENMDKIKIAVGLLAAAFAAAQLVGLIAAIANPIGLVVIAVGALATGLYFLITRWEDVTKAMNDAWGAIQQWAQAEWTTFTDNIGKMGAKMKETWDTMKSVPVLGEIFKTMETNFNTTIEAIKIAWNGLVAFFQTDAGKTIIAAFNGIASAIQSAITNPLEAAKTAWMNLVNAITSNPVAQAISGAVGAVGGMFGGKKAAPAEVPKMAAGGFVNHPMLAQIGEAGPEAVIPLSGSRDRSRGLLSKAAGALGMRGGGGSVMNFTPNITINGPASPETITTLEKKMRELSKDFMAQWQQAHAQERRLAFG